MALGLWTILAFATAAPLVAGLLPLTGRRLPDHVLHHLLGITAGLLLGVAFLDLIPEAIAEGGEAAALTLGLSFLALYIVEFVMGLHGHAHDHGSVHAHGAGDDEHAHEHRHPDDSGHFAREVRFPIIALVALAVHTFTDGLVLPSAFEAGTAVGLAAGIGVAAHKIPDGFAAGTVLVARGTRTRNVVLGVVVIALLTPLGALVGLPLAGEPAWFPHILAVAAGTFIFVAAAELLPELHHGPHKGSVTLGLFIGFALVVLIGVLLGDAGHA